MHTHTQKKHMFRNLGVAVHAHTELHVLGQRYVAGHGKSVHTSLHCNLYKHKSWPQASVHTCFLSLTCSHISICADLLK